MNTRLLACAAMAATSLLLGGCGDDTASSSSTSAANANNGNSSTTTPSTDGGGSTSSPCSVITPADFEAIFGSGYSVDVANASGGKDNCGLTSTGTPVASIKMLKNNASRQSTWDQELQYVTGCKGATPTQVSGVGDRAVVDMSCHAVNGHSLLMTEAGGEIITISASADIASKTDPAAAQPALIDVAQRLIEAR